MKLIRETNIQELYPYQALLLNRIHDIEQEVFGFTVVTDSPHIVDTHTYKMSGEHHFLVRGRILLAW